MFCIAELALKIKVIDDRVGECTQQMEQKRGGRSGLVGRSEPSRNPGMRVDPNPLSSVRQMRTASVGRLELGYPNSESAG